MSVPHLLINGLSVGSGGGFTVAREIFVNVAAARPGWRVSLALTAADPLHEEMRDEPRPANAAIHWAPRATAGLIARRRHERGGLATWARAERVDAVVQLNAMVVPRFPAPTLCHFQDPWPYRPQAWTEWRSPVRAFAQRRAHARSLRTAWACGFTSGYLRDLICRHHGVNPRRGHVFYNGLPTTWGDRSPSAAPPWSGRALELLSVSNVGPYKRQELVVRALPDLVRRPGLERLLYRIVGTVSDGYRDHLTRLAASLGVSAHVVVEGRVPTGRVSELYCRAKAFVLMSVCESFGIPAIEAMSFGTPVVTSDCCAMPEVCGAAAELCPADNVPALVERLARVLTDGRRADELRSAGFERVRKFSWRATADAMAALLDEAVRPATRAGAASI